MLSAAGVCWWGCGSPLKRGPNPPILPILRLVAATVSGTTQGQLSCTIPGTPCDANTGTTLPAADITQHHLLTRDPQLWELRPTSDTLNTNHNTFYYCVGSILFLLTYPGSKAGHAQGSLVSTAQNSNHPHSFIVGHFTS